MSTLTANMNLILPTIGVDSGLTWEQAQNSNMNILDGHNHSPGYGSPIPPEGININSALTFNNSPATDLQATVYTVQSALSTLYAVYVKGNDLYFNDGASNVIQLTTGGAVNATSSGISSGSASASFVASVLTVLSAANTPANIKGRSILLGNNASGSHYLTLSPPPAMAADISQQLPTIPGGTSFMTMTNAGVMGTTISISGGITLSMLAPKNISSSSSSGSTSTTSTSFTNVLTVAGFVTSGRPVNVLITADATSSASWFGASNAGTFASAILQITRDDGGGEVVMYTTKVAAGADGGPTIEVPSGFSINDEPAAATYTYRVYLRAGESGTTASLTNCILQLEED